MDDIITKRTIGSIDNLFVNLNNYHPNISLTLEVNPKQFLDTSIDFIKRETITSVYTTKNNLPVFSSSKIPKRYKRNAIKGELHRLQKFLPHSMLKLTESDKNFLTLVFLSIKDFQGITDDDVLIPEWLFDERIVKTLRLPYCSTNEFLCTTFYRKTTKFH